MSIYEKYKKSRTSWGIDALGTVIVEVSEVVLILLNDIIKNNDDYRFRDHCNDSPLNGGEKLYRL